MKKATLKLVCKVMIITLAYQLVFPACALALTTGPSQPEVQSFEPAGTTEMVDMFTGDFNYNIPLLDVDGYPINIFYHSGISIEQDASWVGLGWNINPGEITRTVRGIPDDFNGEKIERKTNILKERDIRIGVGSDVALEIFGKDSKSLGLEVSLGGSLYVAHNNYRGLSAGISSTSGISGPTGSVGINLGVGTQTGADKDIYGSLKIPDIMGKNTFGISLNAGTGYNSRSGLKDLTLGAGINIADKSGNKLGAALGLTSVGVSIPIGMQNYVPVVANKMTQTGVQVQLKAGMSALGTTVSAYIEGLISEASYDEDASRPCFGYLYLQNSVSDQNILDFSREKDGIYNKTLKNVPPSALTYDIYSVNGNGAGGMFRPHRNDLGSIHDPYVSADPSSKQTSDQKEIGIPGADYGEVGDDITTIETRNESGQWKGVGLKFSKNVLGTLFENVFFKQAGELTYNLQQEASQLFNTKAQYLSAADLSTLIGKNQTTSGFLSPELNGGIIIGKGNLYDRSSRATNISWQTAQQAMLVPEMDPYKTIVSFSDGSHAYDPVLTRYDRYPVSGSPRQGQNMRKDQITEFTQTTSDGRRYVYGLPAINHITKEVTFAVNENFGNPATGQVYYDATQNSKANNEGRDHFYSSTITPSYAHSYLLTALLSTDYVDILGDGPSDDDLGTYVKYNYELKDNDYRWKTPYPNVKSNVNYAQYSPGFWSDPKDGKGNYILGSRQQWYVRSIETKNSIAEFYVSPRQDARGVKEPVRNGDVTLAEPSRSYKLDSIVLYNKHDRYINRDSATPIKTVAFVYSYNLCKGTPNSLNSTLTPSGKLTLEKIFTKYGTSQKNLLSPYVFGYNEQNPNYNFSAKDRWGNYKKIVPGVLNSEFPYTNQPDELAGSDGEVEQNGYLASWNLTDIKLPSGGKIKVNYESDDYSFVQNKRSMQMLHIAGVGSSSKMILQDKLYMDKDNINNYVYFKRRKTKEIPGLGLKENYLEDEDMLYYNFAVDVNACGIYESIKGYAKIEEVGYCGDPATSDYAYIKLQLDNAKGLKIHPATYLGINTGKYYMPHLFYDGYTVDNAFELWESLASKIPELISTIFGENQFKEFLRKQKAQRLKIANSWIRVQTPGLTKKGGGIRVKKIVLSDNWNALSGSEDASYGKQYDYTITDDRYNKISSGVASYEPMIGADENPFRQPVPYAADQGRGLPSTDFFQEEPFGESFFPAASVGYSSVKVTSIHKDYGRSSQALDEHLFYTARDYPVIVDYTEKVASEKNETKILKQFDEAQVQQGYSIQLNDMHGKPKGVNNYVLHVKDGNVKQELITGLKYNYFENASHELDNRVTALVRTRGTQNSFELKEVTLGRDVDFSVDSRSRSATTFNNKSAYNVNILQLWGVPVPIPSAFKPSKTTTKNFKSFVSTKIIQTYGIIKSVEKNDHGAKTVTENLVFDAETGSPILTGTTNEFMQDVQQLSHPAYLAYEGMRPSYTNDGYEEMADSLVVNGLRDGYLYTDNFDRFSDGDELLVTKGNDVFKLWVLGVGTNAYKEPPDIVSTPASPMPKGSVSFAMVKDNIHCSPVGYSVTIIISQSGVEVGRGRISESLVNPKSFCNNAKAFTQDLVEGEYNYTATVGKFIPAPAFVITGSFRIKQGNCVEIPLRGTCPEMGSVRISKKVCITAPHTFCWFPNSIFLWYTLSNPSFSVVSSGTILEDSYDSFGDMEGHAVEATCITVPVGRYHLEMNTFGSFKDHPIGYDFDVEANKTVEYLYRCDECGEGRLMYSIPGMCTPAPTIFTGCGPSSLPPPPRRVAEIDGDAISGVTDILGEDRFETVTKTLSRTVDVETAEGTETRRCALLVAPRFKDKFMGGSNLSTWPLKNYKYSKVYVKILRSGRRNNLNQTVQQTTFTAAEKLGTPEKLFGKHLNILSANANTFGDKAEIFDQFANEMEIPDSYKYAQFNPFVLGVRGNYRAKASFVPISKRSYTYGSVQRDGAFDIPTENGFWDVRNNAATSEDGSCKAPSDLFKEKTRVGSQFWKMVSQITRYDVFGNALEEEDAIGNFSAVQYGYNRSLPLSVAKNAKHMEFMFEGFEDYNMLLPQNISHLFLKGDIYSAFSLLFGGMRPLSNFSSHGQNYYLKNTETASGMLMTRETSHSGVFSLKVTSPTTFPIRVATLPSASIGAYRVTEGKHILQLWAKNSSGPVADGQFKVSLPTAPDVDLKVIVANIDGWYLLEAQFSIPPAALSLSDPHISINIPGNVFIDDLRILPQNANLKCFVYDPHTFKLSAKLDENHMATFFEYDQEGLLIRTKKETERGIMTISENRRSNSKN